uniref:Uncharacterized protein n=1 Tax=Anopheles albimanus TaxID=7167 RepID=A0A182FYH1_ANOAL
KVLFCKPVPVLFVKKTKSCTTDSGSGHKKAGQQQETLSNTNTLFCSWRLCLLLLLFKIC